MHLIKFNGVKINSDISLIYDWLHEKRALKVKSLHLEVFSKWLHQHFLYSKI